MVKTIQVTRILIYKILNNSDELLDLPYCIYVIWLAIVNKRI